MINKIKGKRKKGGISKLTLPTLFLLTFTFFLPEALRASGEPDAFTLNGVGARPGGMGNAFIGLSDDLETVYYNPAGLGNLKDSRFTATYETPMLDTYRTFTAVNKNWTSEVLPGSIALGWLRLGSNNIELTNSDEQVLGTDTLTNDLFLLGTGVQPYENVTLGATVKYFRFSFNGFHETGVGYDLGLHAHYGVLRLGAVLTDINGTTLSGPSSDPTLPDANDSIPMRFRPGLGLVLKDPFLFPVTWNIVADELIKMQGAQETRLSMGSEVWMFSDHAAVRGGYQESSGPTIGLGLRIGPVQLDYSYLFSINLEDENRIGTTFRF